jgi:hypothetical protein
LLRTYEVVGGNVWSTIGSLGEADQSTADSIDVIDSEPDNNHDIQDQCTCGGEPDCSGNGTCNDNCPIGIDPDCPAVCGDGFVGV